MGKTAYIYHPDFLKHDTGADHPERFERLVAIRDHVAEQEFFAQLHKLTPEAADVSAISAVHSAEHIKRIETTSGPGLHYLDSDTLVCEHSYRVALLAAGALLRACDTVVFGGSEHAFCAVRPPGHHAEPDRAMGFCLFNNIAVAARYLQNHHGMDKICIIDWDVHHGNGTQAAFYDDPSVLFISLHQHPLYPGTGLADETGSGPGLGFTKNFPLSPGQGDEQYVHHFQGEIADRVLAFNPDCILISAGFDAHVRDPLAGMQLTESGFAEMTRIVKTLATECCNGRLIATLEGGYDLEGLKKSVAEHLKVLIN